MTIKLPGCRAICLSRESASPLRQRLQAARARIFFRLLKLFVMVNVTVFGIVLLTAHCLVDGMKNRALSSSWRGLPVYKGSDKT